MDTLRAPLDDHAALARELADAGVELALGAWVDVAGRAKSKLVPIGNLPAMLAGSERYTPRGIGDLGRFNPSEDECVAMPDPATLRILPWEPRVAFFNADLLYGGREPFANCPRSILKSVLARAEERGYRFMLGVETGVLRLPQGRAARPRAAGPVLDAVPDAGLRRAGRARLARLPRHRGAAPGGRPTSGCSASTTRAATASTSWTSPTPTR